MRVLHLLRTETYLYHGRPASYLQSDVEMFEITGDRPFHQFAVAVLHLRPQVLEHGDTTFRRVRIVEIFFRTPVAWRMPILLAGPDMWVCIFSTLCQAPAAKGASAAARDGKTGVKVEVAKVNGSAAARTLERQNVLRDVESGPRHPCCLLLEAGLSGLLAHLLNATLKLPLRFLERARLDSGVTGFLQTGNTLVTEGVDALLLRKFD